MTITVLAENTSCSDALCAEHGLSLFIETAQHKLLLDTGASALFAENAEKLAVDLGQVDTVLLSHGHYDHGGGLKTFLSKNNRAKVYAGDTAFGDYFSANHGDVPESIGLDKLLLESRRFVLVGDRFAIDNDLELFSTSLHPESPSRDRGLLMEREGAHVPDDFAHERSLIVREGTKSFLFTGCAHTGIITIAERFRQIAGCYPNAIIGGFHLSHLTEESEAAIMTIGEFLQGTNAHCLTGHCTGQKAYQLLRNLMGDSIGTLSVGARITI